MVIVVVAAAAADAGRLVGLNESLSHIPQRHWRTVHSTNLKACIYGKDYRVYDYEDTGYILLLKDSVKTLLGSTFVFG